MENALARPLMWWGYIHQNGTLQGPKRYLGPLDIREAIESPFVDLVFNPFEAKNSEEAAQTLKEMAFMELRGEK